MKRLIESSARGVSCGMSLRLKGGGRQTSTEAGTSRRHHHPGNVSSLWSTQPSKRGVGGGVNVKSGYSLMYGRVPASVA